MKRLSGTSSVRLEALYRRARWCSLLLLALVIAGQRLGAQEQAKPTILTRKVSYETRNSPLGRVFKDLRRQLRIRLTFNSDHIEGQPPVTISLRDVSLGVLLDEVLKKTNLTYIEEFGGIIIRKRELPATSAERTPHGETHVVLRGRVTDPAGNPLAGVSVRAQHSREMTVTQTDGMFMIVPKENEPVYLSRMGMKPLTYVARSTKEPLVVLKMDTIARIIQEVVVNGYQKIDPRLATGSVFKLNAAEVLQPGVPTIDKMLQGKVPGLMVINTSGSVNASPTMRIRGTSTLIGNAAPLWVIDGMIRPDPVDISSAVLNDIVSGGARSNYEMMGNAVSGVNPYDIESLTFLRDAAATAIYGTRAANGVIVITTKRGKEGPMRIAYNSNFSFQLKPRYKRLGLMDSKERVAFSKQVVEDGIAFGDVLGLMENISYEGLLQALYAQRITEAEFHRQVAALETRNTDWFGELFRNQFGMQHSLSMSGGNTKTTYYASLSFGDNKGAANMDGNKMYGANMNIRSQIGSRLMLDLSLQGNYRTATGYHSSVNPLTYALQTSRTIGGDEEYPRSLVASVLNTEEFGAPPHPLFYNIHRETSHTGNTTRIQSVNVNLALDYKLAQGLQFRNSTNFITDGAEGMIYADQYSYAVAQLRGWDLTWTPTAKAIENSNLPVGGIAELSNSNTRTLGIRNSLDYTRNVSGQRDQFNVSLGHEIRSQQSSNLFTSEPGFFPDRGNLFSPTARSREIFSRQTLSNSKNNAVSGYATAAYSLMNRYILSGTVRVDGNNRFGQYANRRFLPNYSIGGRWNLAQESWFPAGRLVNDWQIKASFGTQGNVVTSVGPHLIATYSGNEKDPVTQLPYLSIKTLPYPDLRWEKTYQWNVGTNLMLLDSRLGLSLDWYAKRTTDVIDLLNIPYEYGLEFMYRNGSNLYNRGLELMVNAQLIRNAATILSVSISTSRNFNKVSEDVSRQDFYSLLSGNGNLPGRAVSGMYSFVFKGLHHETGLPEFDRLNRVDKTSNPDDFLVYSGQTQPKVTWNISPVFRYHSFTMSAAIFVSLGSIKRLNPVFNRLSVGDGVPAASANLSKEYLQRWRRPGDELHTDIPVLVDRLPGTAYVLVPYYSERMSWGVLKDIRVHPLEAYNMSSLRTVKNDYLRCNFLNLSYALPQTVLGSSEIKGLSLGVSVNNVFTIANKRLKGQDPEISGIGTTALPLTRQFAMNINANF
ncbi:SusC/RagA family TonB-linked outer membrane protein [uncultured Chitinophaga sp.]|uniref:SusC/RagA family TonB-linked outer membrane protein n=1 Tax=uncultured Chitinophaga sp. TaxID=339340 RepID=UPI002618E4FD|nr:SusC/RagA family TonB-linked outer membrane protein [uncultured Chitinophaga sp.]